MPSQLCRSGIEAFLPSDYVGAPWRLDEAWCANLPWLHHAGNGGLSIRSRSASLAVLDAVDYNLGQPEDVFYVEGLPRVGRSVASRMVARRFSVESPLEDALSGQDEREPGDGSGDAVATRGKEPMPLGFHAAFKWLPSERFMALLQSISYRYDAPPPGT